MSAETLRRAAVAIHEDQPGRDSAERDFYLAVADWLDDQATTWQRNFDATQQPSRGVDEPPAVHFGDPEAAAANADHHARHAIAVARTYVGESA